METLDKTFLKKSNYSGATTKHLWSISNLALLKCTCDKMDLDKRTRNWKSLEKMFSTLNQNNFEESIRKIKNLTRKRNTHNYGHLFFKTSFNSNTSLCNLFPIWILKIRKLCVSNRDPIFINFRPLMKLLYLSLFIHILLRYFVHRIFTSRPCI